MAKPAKTTAQEITPNPAVSGQDIDFYIGHKIRQRRINLQYSQTDLGNEVGLSYQQIQKYETGVNRVSVDTLINIAHHLKVPLTYFLPVDIHANNNDKSPQIHLDEALQAVSELKTASKRQLRALEKLENMLLHIARSGH